LFRTWEQSLATRALEKGISVVVDDTNLTSHHETTWSAVARIFKAGFEIVSLLDVPIEECIRRDALREEGNIVGEEVIRKLASTIEK